MRSLKPTLQQLWTAPIRQSGAWLLPLVAFAVTRMLDNANRRPGVGDWVWHALRVLG